MGSGDERLASPGAPPHTRDEHTGLPNRLVLLDRLEHALDVAHDSDLAVALHLLRLEPDASDDLLGVVGVALRDSVPRRFTVARLDHDTFAVVQEGVRDARDAVKLAAAIARVAPDARVGLAVSRVREQLPTRLLDEAGAAVRRAHADHETVLALDDELHRRVSQHLALEHDLVQALDRQELRLVYQAEVSLRTGEVLGAEALLRWDHPERGIIEPAEFLDVAEDTGFIVPMGEWALREACREAARWPRSATEGAGRFVAVNLSTRQLIDRALVARVSEALLEAGLSPDCLCLEVTETVVTDGGEAGTRALGRLRELGVRLALDDFGTGHSSLSQLRLMPVDILKVDPAFLARLGDDPRERAVIAAVIALARELGLEVVAEGVETAQQLRDLKDIGFDAAQGYDVSRPGTTAELVDFTRARSRHPSGGRPRRR